MKIDRYHDFVMLGMENESDIKELVAYIQAIYFYELFDEHFNRHDNICTCGYWKEEPGGDMMVN